MMVTPWARQAGSTALKRSASSGIEARVRVAQPLQLGERDGALGQAFEHQIVEAAPLGQLDGRLDAIAGKARAGSDPDRLHDWFPGPSTGENQNGKTRSATQANVMTTDAAKRYGAVNR